MTVDELEQIFDEDSEYQRMDDCKIFLGLQIIRKYIPTAGIHCAEHDEIWSCGSEELAQAGITVDDAIMLRDLDWNIDAETDSLYHFV